MSDSSYFVYFFRFHNDKQISVSSARHKMSMELDEKLYHLCRLEISQVDAADAGTYKAVAKNEFGDGFATINLTFEEGELKLLYHTAGSIFMNDIY